MSKGIREKSQIIDDDSDFRIEELQTLAKETHRLDHKQYQIVSIIGSQSSGKSTLLNALFATDFDVLNRKQRVGQTTKGIWFSVETLSNIIILDVEGSDSNQREERTKIERKNSLFAFAISHTLLINIWIQQIGTFKGAQLQILEVILQLNLKLFGNQKPKQIVFVVRDFVEKRENPEALKEKLIEKVKDAWEKIPKPGDKAHVKLEDVFQLTVFFLPSKLQDREKENWTKGVASLKKFLVDSTKNKELVHDNIPVTDLPRYMQNIWGTISADKDINLPQEKVLLSSMRCQQIKKLVYDTYADELRDEMQKSERTLNLDFGRNVGSTVDKMLSDYDRETEGYIEEEVQRIRQQLKKEVEDKIEESFHKQANMIADDFYREFSESANRIFAKDKNIDEIKAEKPKIVQKFKSHLLKVCYKEQWAEPRINKFEGELEKKFEQQKEKIVNDSVKEFDRLLKKQMENAVSNAFYDREVFTNNFWPTLQEQLNKVGYKSKNSIQGLYTKLELGGKKEARQTKIKALNEKAQDYALQQLKNFVKMKCIDLKYFIMKHFDYEFNNEGDIPRQWPSLPEEDINKMHDSLKKKYLKLVENFREFKVENEKSAQPSKNPANYRMSAIFVGSADEDKQILAVKDEQVLLKKLEEEMGKSLEQALRRNKQTYSASIPTWAFIALGVAAIDDVLLWFASPIIAVPLTLVLVLVVLVFFFGGKSLTDKLLGAVRSSAEGVVANVTRSAASSILKKSN